jgi:NAD(P)-dependent dehydrogenase (short-subunit alcohol dehydrogenase family)
MELGLKGKVAVVTGSSKGIGYSIASALAREGCQVVISARRKEDLEKAAAAMRGAGGNVHAILADVNKPGDIKRLIDETAKKFGTIHILVNNAGGIGRFAAFEDLTDEEWMALFQLNLLSAVRACRAALPWMQKQKWGRIINISSESGTQPDALMPHYNASKAALNNLTKSLSKAYGTDNILVNTVSPAFIRTPLVEEMLAEQARLHGLSIELAERNFLAENRPNIVLGRAGKSDETAGIVVFLASEQSSFVTGANYRVDGGSVASI